MVFGLDGGPSDIQHLSGHLLALQIDDTIVNEGLKSLNIFALGHHFKLFPGSLVVTGFFGINVEGLQVVEDSRIKCSPVL